MTSLWELLEKEILAFYTVLPTLAAILCLFEYSDWNLTRSYWIDFIKDCLEFGTCKLATLTYVILKELLLEVSSYSSCSMTCIHTSQIK